MKYRYCWALCLLPLLTAAQTPTECYRHLYKRGVEEYNAGRWADAIKKWEGAKTCPDKPAKNDLDARIQQAKAKLNPPKPSPGKTAGPTEAQKKAEAQKQAEAAARKADDDAWEFAQGTLIGCQRYLNKYPNGRHAAEARQCVRDLAPAAETKPEKPKPQQPSDTRAAYEPETVEVRGGTFSMGGTEGDNDEKPVHQVSVSTFWMAKYETTNAQFCAFLNEKGNQTEGGVEWIDLSGSYEDEKCRIYLSGQTYRVQSGYENHPVLYVSWYGARAYCDWLSRKTGKNYRLPTEAEWEYAAGGGSTGRTKYAGTDSESALAQYANYCDSRCKESWADKTQTDGYTYTAPVGSLKPNRLGLYDLSGNVWEWCSDWYGADYYSNSPGKDPKGPASGSYRVLRGGSWRTASRIARVAVRDRDSPDFRSNDIGFRVARD